MIVFEEKLDEVKKALDGEAIDYKVVNEESFIKSQTVDKIITEAMLSSDDVFSMGFERGRAVEKEVWNKPEEVFYNIDYLPLFFKAVDEYSKDKGIKVEGVEAEGRGQVFSIRVIIPQQLRVLIGIFMRFGKLVGQHEQAEQHKEADNNPSV